MVVYFATAAPAALAEDLPVVPTAADVAETIQAAVDAAGVPSVTTVADAPEPQPETPPAAPEAAPVAAGTPSESQYQAPVSQYQPDAAPPVTAQAAPPAKGNEVADDDAAVVPPPPSATAAATPDVVASSVAPPAAPQATPATWTWNWNWNCTDPAQAPTPDSNASSWNWNWNWNCDAPTDAATVASQYQRIIGQYQPQNVNVEIRVASPGDSGPVTQSITAVTLAVAAATEAVQQTVDQVVVSAAAPVAPVESPSTLPVPFFPSLPIPALNWPTAVQGPAWPQPAVVVPEVTVSIPNVGTLVPAVEISIVVPPQRIDTARIWQDDFVPPRARSHHVSRRVQAGFGGPWRGHVSSPPSVSIRLAAATAAAAAGPSAAPATHAPDAPTRRPELPEPSLPAGFYSSGGVGPPGTALALGALAALIAAYLLVPPFSWARNAQPRDRRRPRPRVRRPERPG